MINDTEGTVRKDTETKMLTFLKVFFYIFLAFAFFILIYYSLADKAGVIESESVTYIEHWTVIGGNGSFFETGRYFRDNHYYKEAFTIISELPDNISDNSYMCFTMNGDTYIYVDGELRKEFIDQRDVILPGGSVKRFYGLLSLSSADSGKEIKMIRNSQSRHPEIVPETFITGHGGVYSELFDKYGVSFAIALILLIFATIIIIISLIMCIWYHHRIGMFYGALGIFVSAGWLVTNSYLYPFIFGHYHVDGVANYLACLMLPFGLVLYLDFILNGRYRKYLTVILLLSSINAVVWTVLHFTGIYPFYKALLYIDIVLGAVILSTIAIFVSDFRKGNMHLYKYTAIGFIGFMFFGIIELIILTFFTFKQDDIPMLMGLSFFLIFVIMQQADDIRKGNLEKQRAIDLSDAKTKFLANMSHEIRTPINSILGMNEMILRENKDMTINGYAQNVRSSGRMLLMLVNDVLDFSKVEAGKLEITNSEYSLSRLISEIVTMFIERARFKKLELKTEITADVPDGQISDEIRIKQILVNLISNAIKYTDKGSITIAVGGKYLQDDDYELELKIRDTGRGIKEEEFANLFDAFTRADIKKNRNIEGTGLGLAIVKSILDSMGGSITVDSKYGKGSSFIAKIPVKVTNRTPVREDLITVTSDNTDDYRCDFTAPSARVLAVDDNHSNLIIVKLFLKETGIIPDLCSSGTEAVELCRRKKYDLILLDHMMPSPDGVETLNIIRNSDDSLNKDTAAIVLTANAIAGSRQMYMEAGFADYLTKPLDAQKLEVTVKKFLPADKVIPIHSSSLSGASGADGFSDPGIDDDLFVEEFLPVDDNEETGDSDLKERLGAIRGMDYESALHHCGGNEDILAEILQNIVIESPSRINRMHDCIRKKDYDTYLIDAHAIKGLMATIGLDELSAYAKKHEFAARDKDYAFVDENYEKLINDYADVCARLKALLSEVTGGQQE
ncbi:MAG: response regulator [Lachnospiraceae bacterium]|nr:response regulator [Lachnospiraceae bacterium]